MSKYHFIHERGDYPLLAIEDIALAWMGNIKKAVKYNESPGWFIYKNGWCRIYSLEKVHQKIADYTLRKISSDKQYIKKTKIKFNEQVKRMEKFINELKKINFRNITNAEIIKIKKEYSKLYINSVPYGEPLPYFLKEKLQSILGDYLLNKKKISKGEYKILFTPLCQSFLNRENEELFKIWKKYHSNKIYFDTKLLNHSKKYAWLLFDYASIAVNKRYFKERAEEFRGKKTEFLDYKKLKKRKEEIIKKHKINSLHKYYLKSLEDLFYLMDKKKEILTQMHFYITPLYEEAGKRSGLGLEDVRWFLWKEVEETLLESKRLSKEASKLRRKFSVFESRDKKIIRYNIRKARNLLRDIEKDEKINEKTNIIIGISASSGKVRGIIRYLKSARENNKIKKGEILLTSNTTPDYMPAIRRSAAIITNEGGITSHAAIISRELNIPCVIGTKIATKVLKDGDVVEVDAERGIVKIFKYK